MDTKSSFYSWGWQVTSVYTGLTNFCIWSSTRLQIKREYLNCVSEGNGHIKSIKIIKCYPFPQNNIKYYGGISQTCFTWMMHWYIRFHWKHKMYSSLGYSKNYLKIHIKVTFISSFPESEFKLKGRVIVGSQILHQTIEKHITLKFLQQPFC